MKVAVRNEPGSRAVLEIEVPEEALARAMDQAYASLVRRVSVPGFRRGKAPRAILERHLGEGSIREEAIRTLVPAQYSEAISQAGIAPITQPAIDVKDGEDGKGLRVTATVDVYPDVTLPDYRAIHIERESHPIADEDVDRALEDIRARHGRLASAPDEAARRGDFVLLTVTASPAGFERLQAGKEMLVELGGGLLPQEVETALEGTRAGETRTAQLASDQGEVTVRVDDVRRKELPPLDDAFAKTVSDQPTLAALREGLHARLAAERADEEVGALQDRVVDAVLAQTAIDLPESLVEHEVEHVLEDLAGRLQSRGLTLDGYLRSAGKDEAALRAEMRPRAERRVRVRLLLEAVSERESLAVGEEEMFAEVQKLAAELGQDIPKVEAWLAERGRRDGLRETMARRKAIAVLVEAVAGPEPQTTSTLSTPVGEPAAASQATAEGDPQPPATPESDRGTGA
ncbi:MAG TPA: trigger factor [bacterium]|nr:trigger factor [bacterium]